jgi:hypothetical protein
MKTKETFPRWGAAAFLALTFALALPEARHLLTKVYLIGDSLTYYYPLVVWAKGELAQGRLPLLSDLAYHGAPIAAQSSIGLLSPILLFLLSLPLALGYNLLLFLPLALSLVGFYRLGRHLNLHRETALFFSLLASLNGASSVHQSLFIVTWANAFFPWTWLFLGRALKKGHSLDLGLGALCFGLTLFVGHPQMVLLQGCFLAFWVFLAPEGSALQRLRASSLIIGGGLVFSSPRWLHTLECVFHGTGAKFTWNDLDTYFHSWTPFNLVTLVFPDFFGNTPLTGGGTYWWLYHYNEMHFTLGVVGLCFLFLFLLRKDPHRRWILLASLFFVLMALGRFGPLYPVLHTAPPFSWFRDPARWLLPLGWLLALAAAKGFQAWKDGKDESSHFPRIAFILGGGALVFLLSGHTLLSHGQGLVRLIARPFISLFVKGDSLHPAPVEDYIARLPEKLEPLSRSFDLTRIEVFLPLLILLVLASSTRFFPRSKRSWLPLLCLVLGLLELSFFNLRLGDTEFLDPASLPSPTVPSPENRSFSLTPHTPLPDAQEVARLAFPNANFLTGRKSLPFFLYPSLPRYEEIGARLGWMAWVYQDREKEGWRQRVGLLRALGVDTLTANEPLKVSSPFQDASQDGFGVLRLGSVAPQAVLVDQVELCPWESFFQRVEDPSFDPTRLALVETAPSPEPVTGKSPPPEVQSWEDRWILLRTTQEQPAFLVLQKTFLPGWKATVNGKPTPLLRAQGVLCGLALPQGPCEVELRFRPTGLRLGFFLSFLSLALWVATLLPARRGVAAPLRKRP